MYARIAVLPGDGIGPEVVAEGLKVLQAVGARFQHQFECQEAPVGGGAIDKHGLPLPPQTLALVEESQAVLFGAVGGPQWDDPRAAVRPEQALLELRKGLGLFANIRPVKLLPTLEHVSTLKPEVIAGVDLVVVRELTGGLYFGRPSEIRHTKEGRQAVDTLSYTGGEIERIIRFAFELARSRRKKVTSVDKANVLSSSRLWRQIAMELAPQYPDIVLQHMLVDACAMQLVRHPTDFDVIVTENMFGDILTDEAAMLAGSMGMLPSASLGSSPTSADTLSSTGIRLRFGLYEPIHGSAPDIAGRDTANPIATILSVALLLRYSLGLFVEAEVVEKAVGAVLAEGYRTADIMEEGEHLVGTGAMGSLIAEEVRGNI
ncbi:MAG: 3-isopropylmalate dehydrogenase [Chloroflexi bacterium]|nr:3-isopropylmalate dehydrogenase [Chloroflexota bacterium]